MSGRNRKRIFSLGGEKFKRYNLSTKKKSFLYGGWNGIVLFVDTFTNTKVICRSCSLTRYLDSINFSNVKKGKFGQKVRDMAFDYIEFYYFEVQELRELRNYQNLFNRELTRLESLNTQQTEFNFSARKKRSNRNVK